MKELEAAVKANRNTIKSHHKQFQQRGHLKIQDQGKGVRYTIV